MTRRVLIILTIVNLLTCALVIYTTLDASHNSFGGYTQACEDQPPILGDDC